MTLHCHLVVQKKRGSRKRFHWSGVWSEAGQSGAPPTSGKSASGSPAEEHRIGCLLELPNVTTKAWLKKRVWAVPVLLAVWGFGLLDGTGAMITSAFRSSLFGQVFAWTTGFAVSLCDAGRGFETSTELGNARRCHWTVFVPTIVTACENFLWWLRRKSQQAEEKIILLIIRGWA